MIKKLVSGCLIAVCALSLILGIPNLTANADVLVSENIEYFEDGSYVVTTITLSPVQTLSTNTITATKTVTGYNYNKAKLYDITVRGTFKYTGSNSYCTSASIASINIYNTNWRVENSYSTISSNIAIASMTVRLYTNGKASDTTEIITAGLYCDKDGNLS